MTSQRTKPGAVVIIAIEIFKIYTGWNKGNPYFHFCHLVIEALINRLILLRWYTKA